MGNAMPRKVMIVGNYSHHRLAPYLARYELETLLVGWGRQYANLADRFIAAPAEAEPQQLVRWALDWGADLVISRVVPLVETAGARDAFTRELLEGRFGIRMVAHPLATAALTADKAMARHWLTARGYPVPPGAVVTGLSELRKFLSQHGDGPLVMKTPLGAANQGVRMVNGLAEAEAAYYELAGVHNRIVVEAFLDGQELGLELMRIGGHSHVFPAVSLGYTANGHPMGRIRVAPAGLTPDVQRQVDEIAAGLLRDLEMDGPMQADLVVADGKVYVLELNGRLGGVSNLSFAASGIDPYLALLDMAMDCWDPSAWDLERGGAGVDLPIAPNMSEALATWAEQNPHVVEIRHRIDGDWSVSLRAESVDELLAVMETVPLESRRFDVAQARAEVARNARREVRA